MFKIKRNFFTLEDYDLMMFAVSDKIAPYLGDNLKKLGFGHKSFSSAKEQRRAYILLMRKFDFICEQRLHLMK